MRNECRTPDRIETLTYISMSALFRWLLNAVLLDIEGILPFQSAPPAPVEGRSAINRSGVSRHPCRFRDALQLEWVQEDRQS